MSQRLRQWLVGRRLRRLIAHATKIIYSDDPKFSEMFSELGSQHREATPQEIHVAIRAATEIGEEFQRLV